MLEGIRIIEIEGLGPAPFAGMMLADLGAEVVVVHREEPPTPGAPERSLLDRGKQSVVLVLKRERDIELLKRLIARADGLIEGFRPGVMERLGVGPDVVCRENPRLVYGRLTGWGQDGPQAPYAGHDLNYIALSGALWYASQAPDQPLELTTPLGDTSAVVLPAFAAELAARRDTAVLLDLRWPLARGAVPRAPVLSRISSKTRRRRRRCIRPESAPEFLGRAGRTNRRSVWCAAQRPAGGV